MHFSRSSIWLHSCQGILLSSQKAQLCNPCLRNELSPLSQEGTISSRRGYQVLCHMLLPKKPNCGCCAISIPGGPRRAILRFLTTLFSNFFGCDNCA